MAKNTRTKRSPKSLVAILTERGQHLDKAHAKGQGESRPRCKECGCKIRGKNHETGSHHLQRAKMKA